jgi:voltage-gated potassium channel
VVQAQILPVLPRYVKWQVEHARYCKINCVGKGIEMSKVEKPEEDSKSNVFEWFIFALIILNIAAIILNSFDDINAKYSTLFTYFEYFSIVIFIFEYIWRICIAPKKWKFIFSPLAIIDLVVILSSCLSFALGIIGIDLRILRIFRLFRVFKMFRYNNSFQMLANVFKNEKDKLVAMIFIMIILILFASSMMYFFENDAQPDKFPNIPATLWWAIATLTTVGYGDVYPITIMGKLLGGIISVLGIGLVAMPSGIIAMGLIQQIRSTPADPENIYKVLDTLEKYLGYINKAIDEACKKLKVEYGEFGVSGKKPRDSNRYGVYFHKVGDEYYDDNNSFLCGFFPKLCNENHNEEKGKDYVYSLAIYRKAIKYDLTLINKEDYPYFYSNDGWVYIQINRNIFEGENPADKLCERIVDIVKGVYLKNIEKNNALTQQDIS